MGRTILHADVVVVVHHPSEVRLPASCTRPATSRIWARTASRRSSSLCTRTSRPYEQWFRSTAAIQARHNADELSGPQRIVFFLYGRRDDIDNHGIHDCSSETLESGSFSPRNPRLCPHCFREQRTAVLAILALDMLLLEILLQCSPAVVVHGN